MYPPIASADSSMLSCTEIRAALGTDVIIVPFREDQLQPNSYDIRLGEHFYVERHEGCVPPKYNVYDPEHVAATWGYVHPPVQTEGPFAGRRVLWLAPGERVLGHSEEYIGGRNTVTTMIKTRSSLGRSGLSTCLCAGSGDVGFVNRWALEISNHLKNHAIPLVIGERVAQMLFLRTGPCARPYTGQYQAAGASVEELIAAWTPDVMLPRIRLDAAPSMAAVTPAMAKWSSERAARQAALQSTAIDATPAMSAMAACMAAFKEAADAREAAAATHSGSAASTGDYR